MGIDFQIYTGSVVANWEFRNIAVFSGDSLDTVINTYEVDSGEVNDESTEENTDTESEVQYCWFWWWIMDGWEMNYSMEENHLLLDYDGTLWWNDLWYTFDFCYDLPLPLSVKYDLEIVTSGESETMIEWYVADTHPILRRDHVGETFEWNAWNSYWGYYEYYGTSTLTANTGVKSIIVYSDYNGYVSVYEHDGNQYVLIASIPTTVMSILPRLEMDI